MTKSNAQRHAMVLWDEVFEDVKGAYGDVQTDRMLVDAMAARFVNDPASIDTVVATNLHADILSDLAAALAGGLGIAPTGNINPERAFPSMFEPIHGSAFDIMGRGIANPLGSFWSAVLMLEHLGEANAAARLMRAIERVTARRPCADARSWRPGDDRGHHAGRHRAPGKQLSTAEGCAPMADAINPRHRPIISIGECMVELARGDDGRFGLAYGGDTFNTSVYLARAGAEVSYATALGDDPYSAGILNLARHEGVGTTLITTAAGRMPGLYLIETSAKGERTFHYWRDRSPARELFDGAGAEAVVTGMQQAGLVFFSAVTLSLYSTAGLARFAEALQRARAAGATIVMDGNYRPRGWQNDPEQARVMSFAGSGPWPIWRSPRLTMRLCSGAMPTPTATVARLRDLGLCEVAVKLGHDGALVATDGAPIAVRGACTHRACRHHRRRRQLQRCLSRCTHARTIVRRSRSRRQPARRHRYSAPRRRRAGRGNGACIQALSRNAAA